MRQTVIGSGLRGCRYYATTGQYYDHARNYSPGLGRFTALDPLGPPAGDPDLYRYVANSPSNGIDPSGTDGEFSEIPGSPGGIFGSSPSRCRVVSEILPISQPVRLIPAILPICKVEVVSVAQGILSVSFRCNFAA